MIPTPSAVELVRLGPILILGVGMLALLALGAVRVRRDACALWATLFLLAAMAALHLAMGRPGMILGDVAESKPMMMCDPFSVYFGILFLLGGLFGVTVLQHEMRLDDDGFGESLALLFSVLIGMFLVAGSRHLLLSYLGFELLSVPAFAMVALRRGSARGAEAGLKYVVYGGASSGALLYGFSVLYGLSDGLHYSDIRSAADAGGLRNPAGIVAAVLILSGFFYKIAAAPFHWWCPDAYEGATPGVAGFLAVGPKTAGFAFLALFSAEALGIYGGNEIGGAVPYWLPLLALGAILSMTYGNLSALGQKNTSRLLAYSSIAHTGYILCGLATGTLAGLSASIFYLGVYLLMNLGAFFIVSLCPDGDWIAGLRGLRDRAPALAFAMAAFLFSLTGIPPFGGFVGKFFLFHATVIAEAWPLVFFLAVNSVIALFYYARILRMIFLEEEDAARPLPVVLRPAGAVLTLFVLVAGLLALGVAFGPFYGVALGAAESLQISMSFFTSTLA